MNRKQLTVLSMTVIIAIGLFSGCGEKREAGTPAQENQKRESSDAENKKKEIASRADPESGAEGEEQQSKDVMEKNSKVKTVSEQEESQKEDKPAFIIEEKTYEDGAIRISYPYVEHLVNQQITDFYNQEFEDIVAVYAGEAEEGDLAADSQEAAQSFTVTYQSEDMISILIEGSFYSEGMPHPYSYSRSYNINLKTGESMGITDLFTPEEITDNIMAFRYITGVGEPGNEYIKQELEMKGKEGVLEQMNHCDFKFMAGKDGSIIVNEGSPYSYSYRQKDGKWLIVLEGSHAVGDYFTLRYDR